MLDRLRSVLALLCVSLTPLTMAQTPSELQKQQGFAGGGNRVAGLDIANLDSLRGAPFISARVHWAAFEAGVWKDAGHLEESGGLFGLALAMDGDYCVVGAPLEDVNGIDRAGAAYFFVLDRQSQEWIQLQRITASDPAERDHFGRGIALDGNTLAIGALGRGGTEFEADSGIYVLELVNGVWEERQFILPDDLVGEASSFGLSIDIDGDRMAVGAPDFLSSGRAFVFGRDGNGVWQETAALEGAGDEGQSFGHSIDVLGDIIVVGAPNYREDDRGDFRVFRFDGTNWNVEWYDFDTPREAYDRIGTSVALADDGNLIILGAPEGFKQFPGEGHMRAFRFDGEEWIEIALIRPTDQNLQVEQSFGQAMAVDGDWLVVGAPGDDGGSGNNDQGAVYFYDLTGQLGTRALLSDATVQFGTFIAGGLSSLKDSEDSRFRVRSRFGFTASEPNLADLRIGAHNNVSNADVINLLIEARMNQPGGTMKVRLRNWNTNTFNQVHQYSIGPLETVEPVSDIPAASYVRASDNRIELSLRSSALVTLTASGFEAQHDFVNVLVRE